jgi:hypothetical protein
MYRFSRALYNDLKVLVDPSTDAVSVDEARRRVLVACEATVERLAREPRYFTKPARSLFDEIRYCFPIAQHARVYYSIDRALTLAREFIRAEIERNSDSLSRCRATTRKGKPCQRTPLPEREYCPSHQHLEEHASLVTGAAA